MSTAKSSAGERKVLARYKADEGERQLVAQHINGRVALSDVPAGEQGRVHLIERHLGALDELDARRGLPREGRRVRALPDGSRRLVGRLRWPPGAAERPPQLVSRDGDSRATALSRGRFIKSRAR
jgi:hypothetical protein